MIDTVTLNPVFDRHLYLKEFRAEKQNRALKEVVCAGGKGVNVSRVLTLLGAKNDAIAALGAYDAQEYLRLAEESSVKVRPYYVEKQNVRTNTVIHPKNAPETGVSTDSLVMSDDDLDNILKMTLAEKAEYTVFSGRLPQGLTKAAVIGFLKALKAEGTKLTVDSSSLTVADLMEIKPWLIKPNRSEIKALGYDVADSASAKEAAIALLSSGIQNVIVSLDGDGGIYAGEYGTYSVSVPKIERPLSTVGAGDSTVAGFVSAIEYGYPIDKALILAFSCGTAACLTEGTEPPRRSDIEFIARSVNVKKI